MRPHGGASVYFRDPAGNLVEPAPPTIWTGADGRAATPVVDAHAAGTGPASAATGSRRLLQHCLAALAHRTQRALRGAPTGFAEFRAGPHVRTPHELLWHMTGVIGCARTMLRGGTDAPPRLATFDAEVARFHDVLAAFRDDLADATLRSRITDERFLQGPLADVRATNAGVDQPGPAAPDAWWRPDLPPQPPGPAPGSESPS